MLSEIVGVSPKRKPKTQPAEGRVHLREHFQGPTPCNAKGRWEVRDLRVEEGARAEES